MVEPKPEWFQAFILFVKLVLYTTIFPNFGKLNYLQKVKAIILVGGQGTRLRPLTWNTPKSFVPVLNRPFLEYVLHHLKKYGVNDVVFAISNHTRSIEQYFGNGASFGMKFEYVFEKEALGTGGALKNAASLLPDCFFVLNGDIISELNLNSMMNFHNEKKALVTVSTVTVDSPAQYGLVKTRADSLVLSFVEKPKPEDITSNNINAGTYIMEKRVLDLIPQNQEYSSERKLFPALIETGGSMYAFHFDGYWIDIGTPQKYSLLNYDLLSGKCRLIDPSVDGRQAIGQNCTISPTSKMDGSVIIGESCVIEDEVTIIGPTVIGAGCHLRSKCKIASSILWNDVMVGCQSKVTSSIIANNCSLDDSCVIDSSVLGDCVSVSKNTCLPSHSVIEPNQTII